MHEVTADGRERTPRESGAGEPEEQGGVPAEPLGAPGTDRAAVPPIGDMAPDQVRGTPEEPRPLGLVVRPTGHVEVDARLSRLAAADHLDVGAHLEVYEDVHRGLRSVLTALDQDSGS